MATTPHPVSIGHAVRAAAVDFYFNSWRFVPANLAWALVLLGVLFAAVTWPPDALLGVLLAVPIAGLHRMSAILTRGEATTIGDFVDGMRTYALGATAIGAGAAILGFVLVTNVAIGFGADNPIGWFLGATAAWGLVALAMYLVAVWPILVDPDREAASLRRRLQLAGLVVIGRPGRLLVVTVLIVAILVASTALLGAVVLVGVAYCSLLGTRWVLPTADELEARFEAARAR